MITPLRIPVEPLEMLLRMSVERSAWIKRF